MVSVVDGDLSTICTSGDVRNVSLRYVLIGSGDARDAFHDFVLQTPLFQRRYAWTRNEWSRMLRDAINAAQGRSVNLGRVVVVQKCTKELDGVEQHKRSIGVVIDGQQRLSTSTVLLAAARDACIKVCGEPSNAVNEALMFDNGNPRFAPNYADRPSYFAALGCHDLFEVACSTSSSSARVGSQIENCYAYFYKAVCEYLEKKSEDFRAKASHRLIEGILSRFMFLRFLARDNGNLTAIYERLAVREASILDSFKAEGHGVGMVSMDLARNLFLSFFDDGDGATSLRPA